jgi:hypothetical protein
MHLYPTHALNPIQNTTKIRSFFIFQECQKYQKWKIFHNFRENNRHEKNYSSFFDRTPRSPVCELVRNGVQEVLTCASVRVHLRTRLPCRTCCLVAACTACAVSAHLRAATSSRLLRAHTDVPVVAMSAYLCKISAHLCYPQVRTCTQYRSCDLSAAAQVRTCCAVGYASVNLRARHVVPP